MMNKKIAILRGINVGGKRKILMADLKVLLKDLGYNNCSTYIQSGNVFFEADENSSELDIANTIEMAIKETFGFDVPVIVINHKTLKDAIEQNPFHKIENVDIKTLHLTFLKQLPEKGNIEAIEVENYKPDELYIYKQFAFLSVKGKYHQSKLTNALFEKKLKVKASTRNWKTVLKLLELSK